MVRARKELPDVGELLIATVKEIFEYGAYITLDEYGGMEAYLPWSEVATRWVRSIKDVLKENQKIVVKVIRVNRRSKQVDVSLKRVMESERRRKVLAWKRAQRAEKLLEMAATKLGRTLDDAYEEAGWKLEDYYGEILAGLEQAVMRGVEALLEAGVSEDWARVLYDVARKHIEIKKVKVAGVLTLRSVASDGVERIRKILTSMKSCVQGKDVEVRVYTLGAPRYRVEVIAADYKLAEQAMAAMLSDCRRLSKELGVEFSFERSKA